MRRRQKASLGLGSLLVLAVCLPPMAGMANHLLTLRMLQEMVLLMAAGPLFAYGLRPWLRLPAFAGQPLLGMVAFNVALFTWIAPPVVAATDRIFILRLAGELMLLVGATSFWWPVVAAETLSPLGKIGYLLVAGCPPTIPGVLLAFSHRVLYPGLGTPGLPGLSDQQLAGVVLFGSAKIALISTLFVLLWRLLDPNQAEPPDDRGGEMPSPVIPPQAPAWLGRLEDELPAEPTPRVPAHV